MNNEKRTSTHAVSAEGGRAWNRGRTLRITVIGMMAALSVALMYMLQIPIIPAAPYMLYDMADIPILIGTLFFGPAAGMILTVIVSIIQGVTVSASGGIVGIVMHIAATGAFVLTVGLLRKKWKKSVLLPVAAGIAGMTVVMVAMNLLLSPYFYGISFQAVVEMILPIIIPFNLIKAGVNGMLAYSVYKVLLVAFPRIGAAVAVRKD